MSSRTLNCSSRGAGGRGWCSGVGAKTDNGSLQVAIAKTIESARSIIDVSCYRRLKVGEAAHEADSSASRAKMAFHLCWRSERAGWPRKPVSEPAPPYQPPQSKLLVRPYPRSSWQCGPATAGAVASVVMAKASARTILVIEVSYVRFCSGGRPPGSTAGVGAERGTAIIAIGWRSRTKSNRRSLNKLTFMEFELVDSSSV